MMCKDFNYHIEWSSHHMILVTNQTKHMDNGPVAGWTGCTLQPNHSTSADQCRSSLQSGPRSHQAIALKAWGRDGTRPWWDNTLWKPCLTNMGWSFGMMMFTMPLEWTTSLIHNKQLGTSGASSLFHLQPLGKAKLSNISRLVNLRDRIASNKKTSWQVG